VDISPLLSEKYKQNHIKYVKIKKMISSNLIIIAVVSIAGGIGVAVVSIFLLRRRK